MIDISKFNEVFQAMQSQVIAHGEHDIDNPCDACKLKRLLVRYTPLHELSKMVAITIVGDNVPAYFIALEAIIIGIDLGINYSKAEQIEEAFK